MSISTERRRQSDERQRGAAQTMDKQEEHDRGSSRQQVLHHVLLFEKFIECCLELRLSKGIEFQPSFCEYSARAAAAVNAQAEFIAVDARAAAFADGDVFFLYTPFRGALLQAVLSKLHAVAQHKPIRVCTFGPCTPEVARSAWLELESGTVDPEQLAVFKPQKLHR